MRDRPLLELHPRLIGEHRRRYGQGLEFDCPTHGLACRLRLWFIWPDDAEEALPLEEVGALYGHSYAPDMGRLPVQSITLWQELPERLPYVEVPGHWRGSVVDGDVWDGFRG